MKTKTDNVTVGYDVSFPTKEILKRHIRQVQDYNKSVRSKIETPSHPDIRRK